MLWNELGGSQQRHLDQPLWDNTSVGITPEDFEDITVEGFGFMGGHRQIQSIRFIFVCLLNMIPRWMSSSWRSNWMRSQPSSKCERAVIQKFLWVSYSHIPTVRIHMYKWCTQCCYRRCTMMCVCVCACVCVCVCFRQMALGILSAQCTWRKRLKQLNSM